MKTPNGVIIAKYIAAITIGEIIEPNIKLSLNHNLFGIANILGKSMLIKNNIIEIIPHK